MKINFEITHNISSSKGWGRYKAALATGAKIVESSTGNEWVSAAHAGDVEPGAEIVVRLQTMERSGKMRKETIENYDYRVIAKDGSRATLGFWNGLEVVVENAQAIA